MAAETPESPNLYELGDSYGDTQITYSTSSLAGPPQLSYSGPKGEHSFSGEEIATLASALGTEVTVTLEVLPDVAIAFGEEHAFPTIGVFTTTATTIAGPPPGPAQTYEVIALAGVAKLVAF
jgi:hypothetical protein